MTRWLVTGAGGQLGSHLLAELGPAAVGVGRADLDITDRDAVADTVRRVRPDVLVNAAAYTAVDAAESDEAAARAVNADAVGHLAVAATGAGARLIHVSTDYVFDGTSTRPYEPEDPTGPTTVYGRTKLAGEKRARVAGAQVVRTAWVFGGPSANFVDTMLRLADERPELDVVVDQIGSPTYAADLATAIVELGESDVRTGVLHYVNAGSASWHDLAEEVFRVAGLDPSRIRPVSSDRFVRPARRPAWSVLSTAAWQECGSTTPREWRAAVAEYVASR